MFDVVLVYCSLMYNYFHIYAPMDGYMFDDCPCLLQSNVQHIHIYTPMDGYMFDDCSCLLQSNVQHIHIYTPMDVYMVDDCPYIYIYVLQSNVQLIAKINEHCHH